MPHVSDRNAFLAVNLFLEREQHKHVRYRLADLVDALVAPGPDRRPHEMDGRRAGLAQLMLQAQVEIRRVDPDEDFGRLRQPAPLDVPIGTEQAGQALERVHVAEYRQGVHGMPRVETTGLHLRPAYAFAADVAIARLQTGNDATGQQIARGLAGHHADPCAHGRMMPRLATSRKSSRIWSCGATSGSACWRARNSARAASRDSPRR